jgi:hypothetical protein
MDASGDRPRADLTGFVRQLMFDAAWLAHQGCCYWSAVVTPENGVRGREKKEGGVCRIEHIRAGGAATVALSEKGLGL